MTLFHVPGRRLASFFAALALALGLFTFGAVRAPAIADADSCSYNLTVWIYEDVNFGGRNYPLCGNHSNYRSIPLAGTATCHSAHLTYKDWNDCVSSISWNLTGNSTVDYCFYTDANYAGSKLQVLGGTYGSAATLPYQLNDWISSSKWITHGGSC